MSEKKTVVIKIHKDISVQCENPMHKNEFILCECESDKNMYFKKKSAWEFVCQGCGKLHGLFDIMCSAHTFTVLPDVTIFYMKKV